MIPARYSQGHYPEVRRFVNLRLSSSIPQVLAREAIKDKGTVVILCGFSTKPKRRCLRFLSLVLGMVKTAYQATLA